MSASIPGHVRAQTLSPIERAIKALEAAVLRLRGASVQVGDAITRTGETANISATRVITYASKGLYKAWAIAQCTTAGTAGSTMSLTLRWTDRVGAQSGVLNRALDATGTSSGSAFMQVENNTHITYETSLTIVGGTPVYALEVRLEKVP